MTGRAWSGRPGRWTLPALAVATLVAGCGPRASVVVLDLGEDHDEALTTVETALVDFGTEAARCHLGVGWQYDERDRNTGDTFVWSRGEVSEIGFHLGWRRDLDVEIVGHPFQFPGASAQTLTFELNGRAVGESVSPPPDHGRIGLRLPADAQRVGENTLRVRYGRIDSPADVIEGATDERRLAYAWSEMRFNGVDDRSVVADRGTLVLPAGARVDHFVELVPGSELWVDRCEPLGEGSSVLEVGILGEHDTDEDSFELVCSSESKTVHRSAVHREGLTRIRVSIRPAESGLPVAGVRLLGARVLSPAGPAGEAPPERSHSSARSCIVGPRPNVIIYLVDALRSDRLGAYGCDRGLSPRLDAMAAEGITFTDVTAQSSWTKAAVASIFTGIWPRAHGVNGPDDRLPDHLPTLPERLHDAGYRTGAVVANAYVGRPFGFARGFDHFEFLDHTRGRSEAVGRRVERWLRARGDDDAPFFLYVHTIDPHAPYAPPERFRKAFAAEVKDPTVGRVEIVRGLVLGSVRPTPELGVDLRALYDAEVAANDASFGRLLDLLDELGELDETLVIFTSDHGEAFGEHGSWTHGLDLYNEVLDIPLVMRLPGGRRSGPTGLKIDVPVSHIDLLPTILDRCEISWSDDLPGVRLLSEIKRSTVTGDGTAPARKYTIDADRTILAYLDYWGRTGAAAIRDGWKLIEPLSADFGTAAELYRHDLDRTENRELAAESPVRRGWLGARLGVALRHRGESLPTAVGPEVREQLEALGYVQ